MDNLLTALIAAAALVAAAAYARWWLLSRRPSLGTAEDRATYETLHTTALAAPGLRRGLDAESAAGALPHVRTLLGARTVAITDAEQPLAWDGPGRPEDVAELMAAAIGSGTTKASGGRSSPRSRSRGTSSAAS